MNSKIKIVSKILVLVLIAILALSIVALVIVGFTLLLRLVLPLSLALIIQLFLFYLLGRQIVTYLVFPGCSFLYKRRVELAFMEAIAQQTLDTLRNLNSVLSSCHLGDIDPEQAEQLIIVVSHIRAIVEYETKPKIQKQEDQIQMHRIFNSVKVALKNCALTFDQHSEGTQQKYQLWNIHNFTQDFSPLKRAKISDIARLQDSISECSNYIEQQVFVQKNKGRKARFKRWLQMKVFGSLSQLRAQLMIKYPQSEQTFVTSSDGTKIQVFWFPCENAKYSTTMIYCGPNGMYAEMLQGSSEIIEFYHKNSINFVIFNYRGYGSSQGLPNMAKIKQDGIAVAQYIRTKIGPDNKIGAHGQSMGGAVASHIARHGYCQFLFADRTFSSLNEVPRFSMGNWASFGVRFFLGEWDQSSVQDYIYTNCYKVIAADPNDDLIVDQASLKTGISKKIVHDESRFLKPPVATNYSHILSLEDIGDLWGQMKIIFDRIFELQLHQKKLRQKLKSTMNTSRMAESNRLLNQSVDSNFQNLASPRRDSVDQSYLLTERDQDPEPFMKLSRNQDNQMQPRIKNKQIKELEVRYRGEQDDQITNFPDYLEFLCQILKVISQVDAAGITLKDVLYSGDTQDGEVYQPISKHCLPKLELWILNLDVWGSYLPLTSQQFDIQVARALSFTKFVQMQKRLARMIEFWQDIECGPLIRQIQAALESVKSKFDKIEGYLRSKQQSSDVDYPLPTDLEQDSIEIFTEETQADFEVNKPICDSQGVRFKDFSQPNLVKTGFFIPLSCGHNGSLSLIEKTLLEIHLTNAGMIHDSIAQ